MTIAQTRAARRRIKNDPRWAKRARKDPVALARQEAKKIERQKAQSARSPKKQGPKA